MNEDRDNAVKSSQDWHHTIPYHSIQETSFFLTDSICMAAWVKNGILCKTQPTTTRTQMKHSWIIRSYKLDHIYIAVMVHVASKLVRELVSACFSEPESTTLYRFRHRFEHKEHCVWSRIVYPQILLVICTSWHSSALCSSNRTHCL